MPEELEPYRAAWLETLARRARPAGFDAMRQAILRGRPLPFLTPANGYMSKNVDRAEMRFDCGFTVDGEIFAPQSDEVLTLTADRRVTFVRA